MEAVEFTPRLQKSSTLPLNEILLLPIGDVQYAGGGPDDPCDVERFKRHIEWGVAQNAYFIGMGDYVDEFRPSTRNLIDMANRDDLSSALEEIAEQRLTGLQAILKGTKGRWFGLLEGHHYHEFDDGTTSDTRLAEFLDTPFLGDCALVNLKFNKNRPGCKIWCHHGEGGGLLTSAPLNKLEHKVKAFDADLYLMGHQHKKVAAPLTTIYLEDENLDIQHRKKFLIGTGSFLRGYLQGSKRKGRAQGTYVEQKMLNPTALGGVAIRIRPRTEKGKYHLDFSVEQ